MRDDPFDVAIVPRAARDLEPLPAKIATACVEFIFTTLAVNPAPTMPGA